MIISSFWRPISLMYKRHFKRKKLVYQQESVSAHKGKVVQDFCESNFPDVISYNESFSNSPDCKPIDYCVEYIRYKNTFRKIISLKFLKKYLVKAWDEVSIDYLCATLTIIWRYYAPAWRTRAIHLSSIL